MGPGVQSAHPVRAAIGATLEDGQTYLHATLDVHRWSGVHFQAASDKAIDVVVEWSMDGSAWDALAAHTTAIGAGSSSSWNTTPRARAMRISVENNSGETATFSLDFFLHEATIPHAQLPLDANEDSVEAHLTMFDGADWIPARGSSDGRLAVLAGHDGAASRALATDGDGRVATEARCSGFDGGAWRELLTDGDGRVAAQARLVGYDAGATTWRDVAVDGDGKLVVAPEATTPAAMAYSGAASHTPVAISTGAGELLTIAMANTDSVMVYVWLYDDDGSGVDENTTPAAGFALAASGMITFPLPTKHPWYFSDGVCFRATTGSTHTDTNSPGAPVHITIAYVS